MYKYEQLIVSNTRSQKDANLFVILKLKSLNSQL